MLICLLWRGRTIGLRIGSSGKSWPQRLGKRLPWTWLSRNWDSSCIRECLYFNKGHSWSRKPIGRIHALLHEFRRLRCQEVLAHVIAWIRTQLAHLLDNRRLRKYEGTCPKDKTRSSLRDKSSTLAER